MLAQTAPYSSSAALLRRFLPYVIAGLFAAALLAGYNIAFAQDADPVEVNATDISNLTTMMAAFLVFFMQAGFAFLGAGLIRSKNVTNYMTKSFMDFAIASLSFWAFGFAIMTGTSAAGIAGTSNFFLADGSNDWQVYVDWMFQMVFARNRCHHRGRRGCRTHQDPGLPGLQLHDWRNHLPALRPLGVGRAAGWVPLTPSVSPAAADYAGSGVVHAVGGFIALAGAAVVGPRIGKFNSDGSANELPIHSVPFVIIGTFILFFGWFGFNINSGSSIGPQRHQHAAGRRNRRGGRALHHHCAHRPGGHPDGL